jgi:predicted RNA-binding Zn-ribbon protein involved in translation (DUF1610 family)
MIIGAEFELNKAIGRGAGLSGSKGKSQAAEVVGCGTAVVVENIDELVAQRCPECGGKVTGEEDSCRSCGYPLGD